MFSFSWLRGLRSRVSTWSSTRTSGRRRRRVGVTWNPLCERLEDRTLPSTVTWINPSGGDWDTGSNWSSGAVPGPNDDVVIDMPGQNSFTVTHAANVADAVNSLTSQDAIWLYGGSLAITAASTIHGDLTVSYATLAVAGDLTVAGLFTLEGGTLQGVNDLSRVTAAAGMTCPGGVLGGITLENALGQTASLTWILQLQNGARFENDGTLNLSRGAIDSPYASDGTFVNYGQVTVAGPGGYINVAQDDNEGLIEVDAGSQFTLGNYNSAAHWTNDGTITAKAGSQLFVQSAVFISTPAAQLNADWLSMAPGTFEVQISGASAAIGHPTLAVTSSATLGGIFAVVPLDGFTPTPGETFTLIHNLGTLTGTFTNPGGVVSIPGSQFQISYTGGNGQDVLLTATALASAGGPYSVTYGDSLTLDASGSGDLTSNASTCSWTINGVANAASGVQPVLSWAQLQALGAVPGQPFAVSVTISDTNGLNLTSVPVSVAVNKATPTVNVTANGGTFNGQSFPATASVAGVISGVDSTLAASLEGVAPTLTWYAGTSATGNPLSAAPSLAGTWTVVAAFAGSADYTAASASTTFLISPATPIVTVTDGGGMYVGQGYPATATVAGVVSGVDDTPGSSLENVAPTLAYYAGGSVSGNALSAAPTLVGTYTVVASFAGSADYAAASASTTFTIAASTPILTVADAGGTYNGQAFPATVTVAGVVTGVDSTPAASLEGVAPTLAYYAGTSASGNPLSGAPSLAGTWTVVASFAGSTDYAAASASTTFTISSPGGKSTPTLVVTDSGGTFTGKPFPATVTVAGVTGRPAGSLQGVKPTLTYYALGNGGSRALLSTAPSAVGNYEVDAAFAGSSAYTPATASTTFRISLATPALAVHDKGGTFNGQSYPATATVAGVNGKAAGSLEGVGLTLTYYSGTTRLAGAPSSAGSYVVVASFAGSADYAAVTVSSTFSIARARAKLNISDKGGTYNGQSFTATATVAGVVAGVDDTPAASLEATSPTLLYYLLNSDGSKTELAGAPAAPGRYEVDAFFAGSADYGMASRSATFTIKRATPAFSSLAIPTITRGTTSVVLSGTLSLGNLIPTGVLTITIDGVSVIAVIQSDGTFSATFDTTALRPGKHTITWSYAGDEDFNAIRARETLTVTR